MTMTKGRYSAVLCYVTNEVRGLPGAYVGSPDGRRVWDGKDSVKVSTDLLNDCHCFHVCVNRLGLNYMITCWPLASLYLYQTKT